MNISHIIAIDPGKTGALAYGKLEKGIFNVASLPSSTKMLRDFLRQYENENVLVFVEKALNLPPEVSPGRTARIKINTNFTKIKTTLELFELPYVEVSPVAWQNGLNLRKKGEEYSERKSRLWEAAKMRNPAMKIHKYAADAVLIYEFGKLKIECDMDWILKRLPGAVAQTLFQ